ncbi:methyltransferase domain-containing protein [uncultured Desulfuromonas sp.]|uniref:methyltransferase domain-containing protein n=1 Tax=uncultured Desulfuromonas sp. TaxID=181013 RepID=UPI002AABE307|nr:methyltransferase domain-containing protein [uncultured Desulfuromonas sp.]
MEDQQIESVTEIAEFMPNLMICTHAPEYTLNIGAQYRRGNGLYSRVDLTGYGEMFLDRANDYSRESYEIVTLKVGYETEHYDIYLYGNNIFALVVLGTALHMMADYKKTLAAMSRVLKKEGVLV